MDKSEFERRAAEMRARNLAKAYPRPLPPPPSIFAPRRPTPPPAKIAVRDFLRDVDIEHLSSPLAAVTRKLRTIETDRDGLLDFSSTGIQIAVSTDLFTRGIKAYDAVLKGAAERGWPIKTGERSRLQIIVCSEPLEPAVAEKIEPIPGVPAQPGGRRPRRPTMAIGIMLQNSDGSVIKSQRPS